MDKINDLILTINSGSSSIKIMIFKNHNLEIIYQDTIEKITNHNKAFDIIFKKIDKNLTNKYSVKNIKEIGHRYVNGGEEFITTTKITKAILSKLDKLTQLAPLHNPYNLLGIQYCLKQLKHATNYAIFDTEFYSTLPEKAYLYAIPYKLYSKYKIRKYGFHGISHKYVINTALNYIKKKNAKIISCHIGNGVSVTASVNGKAVDTSMGFTPLQGLTMGTRSGDIDPAIIFYLEKNKIIKYEKIEEMLQKESGIKGLSEISHDMRELRDIYFNKKSPKKLHKQANRTLNLYCYNLAKYIGSYITAMNGIDTIIFTATIGEKADYIRKWVCEYLTYLNIKIDTIKNKKCTNPKKLTEINHQQSKIKLLVIPTQENLQIAKEIQLINKYNLLKQQ